MGTASGPHLLFGKERDMTSIGPATSWICRLGRHHYVLISDQNLENRRSTHLECSRCGKLKEIKEYRPTDGTHLAGGG
jgi:hypothetical protein